MLHPYVQHYFDRNPQLDNCYETFDGIFHPTKEAADEWVKKYTNKKVIEHTKLIEENKLPTPGNTNEKHIVTEEDLKNNPDLETKGVKVGDEIDITELETGTELK